jgi:photosystem II stability/assembly factor-like uncharacterized protein
MPVMEVLKLCSKLAEFLDSYFMPISKSLHLLFGLLLISSLASAQAYKEMMYDPQYSIQEVKAAAEAWFEEHGTEEGSGYKGYQRWLWANEWKYPDGDRSKVDPYFLKKQWEQVQANMEAATSQGWIDMGPYQIDSLSGGYNPGLGRVECFYSDPNDPDFLYLGSRSGGFWSSSNGGQTWNSSSTEFLAATGVNTLTVNPSNRDSVLINLRNARNGASHGIYRSVDGGQTWDTTAFNPTNVSWTGLGQIGQVYQIAYHPTIPGRVYIGTNSGLYISNDDLQSTNWTQVEPGARVTHIKFHPTDTAIMYMFDDHPSNRNVVRVSQDGGLTFTSSASLVDGSGAFSTTNAEIAVSPDCPDCLYAASNSGVWKSLNKGQTFKFMSNPTGVCDGFAVSDQDTSIMIYGMLEIYQSSNGGVSFNKVANWFVGQNTPFNSPNYVHADLREIESINGEFVIGTDGYLARSNGQGTSWTRLSRGTGIREFYALGLCQGDQFSTVTGSQDNGTSFYRPEGWVEFYGADGMEGLVHPLNRDWMMGSVQYGTRRLTFDGGRSQQSATPANQTGAWEAPLDRSSTNHFKLYHFGDYIYSSNDFGQNWTRREQPFGNDRTIAKAAIAPNDGNLIAFTRRGNLRFSFDGGQTSVSSPNNPLPGTNHSISDVAFAPHSDSILVVSFASYQANNNKVFITFDQGNTWTNITGNLGDMPIRCVAIDDSPDHNIYLGAEIGVYVKAMNANNWFLYNTNLPNTTISDLEIHHGANILRAATWGRGMWQISLKDRGTYPKIWDTRVETPPSFFSPTDAMPQDVYARISYAGTIDTVYAVWSANSLDLDSTIGMVYTQDSIWKTIRPIPKLELGGDMHFKVYAVGSSNDTSATYRFHYKIQDTGFCKAGDQNSFTTKYIDEVILSNLQAYGGRAAYTDYTNLYANLNANQVYSMSVLVNGNDPGDVVRAWIDYNNDTVFSESEALPFGPIDATNYAYATFTAPQYSGIDTVRMRVRVMDSTLSADPCNYFDGEVEDFSVILIGNDVSLGEQNISWPSLYPNPTKDILYFRGLKSSEYPSYRIYSLSGALIMEGQSANLNEGLSLKGLAKGSYIFEWEHESGAQERSTFIKE